MIVRKCGRTTGLTFGVITDCSRDSWTTTGYYFKNQILIKPGPIPFAGYGDSRSVMFWTSYLITA